MPVGVFVPSVLAHFVNITIEVENTGTEPMNVSVSATEVTGPLLGNLQFPGCICPAGSIIQIQTTANTAHLVNRAGQMQRFRHQWKWKYMQNHIKSYDLAETTELIYVIPHLPAPPWEVHTAPYSPHEMKYVWTGLLDICYEACLQYTSVIGHMPNTDAEYVSAFTYELNQNPSFCYDTLHGASYYSVRNSGHLTAKLKKYLKDRRNLRNRLNCTDCATLLQITCRACGIEVSNAIMTGCQQGRTQNYFDTNEIIAIGCTNWAVPFSGPGVHGGFAYHEITAFDSSRNQNTSIYDACLKIDAGMFPSQSGGTGNPPYVKQPLLPSGLAFAETGQDQVNVPPPQPYQPNPNCYRERLVSHGQMCNIFTNIFIVNDIDLSVALQREVVLGEEIYLDSVRERYGLLENPLPQMAGNGNMQSLKILSEEPFRSHCRMTEDYGRNRVYCLKQGQTDFRIEVTFAFHEKEAYVQLVYALSHISNPYVRRVEMGDVGYAIDDTFYLFVKKNVLVRISNETEGSTVSAGSVACIVCDSL